MSEFIDQIKYDLVCGGSKKAVGSHPMRNFIKPNVTVDKEPDVFKIANKYSIGVELRHTFYAQNTTEATHLRDQFIHVLKDKIYGCITKQLHELEFSIYNRDFDKASMLLRDIFKEIN